MRRPLVHTAPNQVSLEDAIDRVADCHRAPARDEVRAVAVRIKDGALSDPARAAEHARRLLGSTPPGSGAEADALVALAHAECYAGLFEDASAHIADAVAILEREGPPSDLAAGCAAAVQPLARLGRLDEAERMSRRALELHSLHSTPFDTARARVNLAIILRMRGRPAEALDLFTAAEPDLAHSAVSLGALCSNRAEALLDLDRFAEAERAFRDALNHFDRAEARHAHAITLGNIADLLGRLGRPDESLDCMSRAREAFEAVGATPDIARLACEEAEMLAAIGARAAALDRFNEWLPKVEKAGLAREAARFRLALGLTMLEYGAPQGAQSQLDRAQHELIDAGLPALAAEAAAASGLALAAAGNADGALAALRNAASRLADAPARRARVLLHAAAVALDAGRASLAATLLREARACTAGTDVLPIRATALQLEARLARLTGAPDAAERCIEAVRAAERLRDSTPFLEARAGVSSSRQSVYLQAASALLDRGGSRDAEGALEALERMRARTLLDFVASHAPPGQPDAGLNDPTHARDTAELSALYTQLGLSPARLGRAPSSLLADRTAELERRCELRRQRAGHASRPLVASPSSPDRLRASLREREVVVSYFDDDGALSAIVVSAGAIECVRALCSLEDAARAARRVRFVAERAAILGADTNSTGAAQWFEALASLRRLVWEPLAAAVPTSGRDIALVPFGPLHAAPLTAALAAVPIAVRPRSVVMAPSATMSVFARERPASAPGRRVVVAVADEFAPLAEHEARLVAEAIDADDTLTGPDATADRALAVIAEASVLHLATHCVFEPHRPMSSRLRFADRWCTARELLGRVRPGATVVLAGCQTGATAEADGEDRFGMARAFIASGASAVVASMWSLHDAAAAECLVALHRELAAGSPASAALLTLLDPAAPFTHPAPLRAGLFVKGTVAC